MSARCQVCKTQEAVWAMQYIACDSPSFYTLGSHIRGFKVTKVCDACRELALDREWKIAETPAEHAYEEQYRTITASRRP